MKATLTPKQKEVLDFIVDFNEQEGYAPSQQEIAQNFGFKSLGTVQNYLVRLERSGFLQKSRNAHRGMQVVQSHTTPSQPSAPAAVPLPLLGRVAAGVPIEAIPNQDSLEVPVSMLKQGEHFVLKVAGDSMIEDGILDGDYVVIKKQANANNGQTVVALIGNEATLKRFYRRPDQIELLPANSAYEPIIVDSMVETSSFKVEGIMVGLIRQLE